LLNSQKKIYNKLYFNAINKTHILSIKNSCTLSF